LKRNKKIKVKQKLLKAKQSKKRCFNIALVVSEKFGAKRSEKS
jgi:hypothetical protein